MRTDYKRIEIDHGTKLEEVIEILKNSNVQGERISIEFNGHILYSNQVDEDEIYKQITGRTKAEHLEFIANEEKLMVDKFKKQ